MQYKEINKHLVLNKSLRKMNKQFYLTRVTLCHLAAIHVMKGDVNYLPTTRIYLFLAKINMCDNYRNCCTVIEDLCARNYLIQSPIKKLSYKLSIEGINVLNIFEETLRKTRWNR